MDLLMHTVFFFFLAIAFACVEIESEGKYGWAEKMPTWYRTRGVFAKLYGLLMGGKPLTGYHAFMFFIPLLIFHVPFFMSVKWSLEKEYMAMALYFLWCPLWDFLWFLLNPYYGLEEFKQENIWWHAKSRWIAGTIPMDYYVSFMISLGLAFLADTVSPAKVPSNLWFHFGRAFGFLALTAATIFLAPLYHHWYHTMHDPAKDDRPQAGIFPNS